MNERSTAIAVIVLLKLTKICDGEETAGAAEDNEVENSEMERILGGSPASKAALPPTGGVGAPVCERKLPTMQRGVTAWWFAGVSG